MGQVGEIKKAENKMPYIQSSPFKQRSKYPVIEKKLEPGVIAEANDDGTIFVSEDASPAVQANAVKEEEEHQVDLQLGNKTNCKEGLCYTDSSITHNGNTFPRKDGKILFKGKWLKEGDKRFPWEASAKQRAYGNA